MALREIIFNKVEKIIYMQIQIYTYSIIFIFAVEWKFKMVYKGCPKSHFTVLNSYFKRTIKDRLITYIMNKRGNSKFIFFKY